MSDATPPPGFTTDERPKPGTGGLLGPGRPPSLRNLGGGRGSSPSPGTGPADAGFRAELDQAIDQARIDGLQLPVFRLRHRLLGVQIWSEIDAASDQVVAAAVDRRLAGLEPPLTMCRISRRELLAFGPARDASAVRRCAGQILTAMTSLFDEAGDPVDGTGAFAVSPRLGLAIVDDSIPSADQAIRAAGETLAQTDRTAPYLVYNDYIRRRGERERAIERELPAALADGRVAAGYRGRFSAADHTLRALEVYPRWERADGPVPKVRELLRLAERSGRLFEVGQVVRRAAGADAVAWQGAGMLNQLRLWFNVAPAELCHPSFLSSLVEFRDTHPDIDFGVELSDSILLEEPICTGPFEMLQRAGIAVALDTVTMSSLSFGRIQRLPLTSIHLGRDLVHSLSVSQPGRDLVRLICRTAHDRGMLVGASEVQNEDELAIAAEVGIDLVQGPALSGSMSAAEANDLLRSGRGPDRRRREKEPT